MAAAQEVTIETAAAPFWWSHRTVAEAADPLDATADDAAAACMSAITRQTAQHVAAHREAVALAAAATGNSSSAALYATLRWDAVLLPHLTQLRKCMARAHEERVAEQAESSAAAAAGESAHASGSTGAAVSAAAAGPVDIAQARRVRSVQQQIYVAFFKAVLGGFADGAEAICKPIKESEATPTDTEAVVKQASRVLETLLDGLLAHLLRFACGEDAATAAAAALARADDEDRARQPRRGQHRHAAASALAEGWMTGMLPLYLRASQQQQQELQAHAAERLSEEEEARVAASSSSASLPSPARCLVSYVGAFVRGAGLQLLPSEQAATLQDLTRVVHDVFNAQLRHVTCSAVAYAAQNLVAPVPPSEASAHIRRAADVLRAVLDAQLYAETTTVLTDADYTVAYAPLAALRDKRGVAAEFSLVPLLVFSSHAVCGALLVELGRWWVACKQLKERASLEAPEAPEGAAAAAATASHDADAMAVLEQSWTSLSTQAVAVTQLLSTYPDTTLHMAPYTAMLTELFYSADAAGPSPLPLERTEACLCDVRAVVTHSGVSTSSTATVGRRQLRSHFRHVRDGQTLAAAVSMQAEHHLSLALDASRAAAEEEDGTSRSGVRGVAALALALLHSPVTVLLNGVLTRVTRAATISDHVRVDPAVRDREVVKDPGASQSIESPPSVTSVTRAKAITDTPLTGAELVELCFPHHYRLFTAVERALQYSLQRAEALRDADSSGNEESHAEEDGSAVRWMRQEALPAALARYIGAALDVAILPPQHHVSHEVVSGEVLMFVAAVFRTLPDTVLPQLRAALTCVVGEGGHGLMAYLRRGIVDQQRLGLAAFFVPPLRALALDYATVDDVEESLALAAPHPIGCAMAYTWELPRLYFWKAADMPVAEAAWNAHSAAQEYLCELLAPASPSSAAFIAVLQEAAAVVQQRGVKASARPSSDASAVANQLTWARSLAIDTMASLYYGMYRWCTQQLDAAAATSSSSSSEAILAVVARLTRALCAVRPGAAPVPHPFALSLREHLPAAALSSAKAVELDEEKTHASSLNEATDAGDAPQPSPQWAAPHRWLSWFWACTFGDVDGSARVQAAAKRLLRDFSVQGGAHAPVKTLQGIRAMVEQRMRKEGEDQAATAVVQQRAAIVADMKYFLTQQQQQQQRETGEEESTATATETETTATSTTADLSVATPTKPVEAATQRAYLDQVHEALVKRARVSPVDGAVSAVVLGHLLSVLSDPQLPLRVTAQERQRLCQRFVFALTNALPECTRLETVSCACSLRLVLQDIVLPFKMSFLLSSAATGRRAWFPDTEADAFRMVHNTWGDTVATVQKLAAPQTSLGDWRVVLVLQQVGESLSLVRSAATKIIEGVRKHTHVSTKSAASASVVRQLRCLEENAARTDRGAAADVYHLYTLNPPSAPLVPSRVAAVASSSTPAEAETPATLVSGRVKRPRGGASHHRRRSRERDHGGGGGLKRPRSGKKRGGDRPRH